MNKNQQKEFLNIFLNPSKLFDKSDQSIMAKNIQNDIINTIGSEIFGDVSRKPEDIDVDSFLSMCEEMSVNPIDEIESMLNMACKDIKSFDLNGNDISLEALPDFFKKAKENFTKQKESEDIKNF